ncbi:MAG: methyltransferase [Gemmatimonadaceae bacterium]
MKPGYVTDDYRTWRETSVHGIALATKPGVFAHGSADIASLLLARHVHSPGTVVHLNAGNALLAVALKGQARTTIIADRNVLAIEAAARTLALNGATAELHIGHGALALPRDTAADVVAIRIPHEKVALLQLLHDAFAILKPGGECIIAGANNEGAKSAARLLEQLFGHAETIATESGYRAIRAIRQDACAGVAADASPYLGPDAFLEQKFTLRGEELTFFSRPGVFSWDHLDEATSILVDTLEVNAHDRVLDLGCGYGVLGTVAGRIARDHPVTMLDVDSEAVRSATRSAHASGLANARVLGSDIASAVLEEQFDLVVTNPPFHVGKSTDLGVPIQFIADAFHVLAPGGRLSLVANRTLPYEGAIKYLFGNIAKVHDGRRFKVLTAVKGA